MSTAPTPSLPHKPHIKAGLSPHTVSVESQTKAGIFYTVNVATGRCSCPAGKYGRRLCWHLGTALAYDAWRAQQQSSVILTTAPVAPAPLLARPAGMAALQECFG